MGRLAIVIGALMLWSAPALAEPISAAPQAASEFSAQSQRPRARIRVYPGRRLLYRDCTFRLAQEWRPGGVYIVPRQRCWWVRG